MKKAVLIVLFFTTTGFASEEVKVFNAVTVVNLIKQKIATIKSFSGGFAYKLGRHRFAGRIFYQAPDKFDLEFGSKRIFTDGKYLYIEEKGQDLAVKEYLGNNSKNPVVGWNIKRLLREYTPTFPKDGYLVRYGKSKKKAYRIRFVPKRNTAGFRSIEMIVSTEGLIQKVTAKNQIGKILEMSYTYGRFNSNIPKEKFEFNPDENTQIYENIWETSKD